MDSKLIKDVLDLTKQGISTLYNIGQMARYRYLCVSEKESQKNNTIQVCTSERNHNREKMIKYTCLAGLGILGLFAIGISGLSRKE